ncbi:metallophosphoesterase [Gordonia sp. TBRC 11910]|uniref:Metallophosphoesterase n=1 Tax=Gordonia asplenii TaxID=2725283 RepID=A0A848L0M0_9ACTN|nr:metallophosphoesterase [Gordonia asplenii]
MRILVIADISPKLGMSLPDFVAVHGIDVVVSAGDLTRYDFAGIDRVTVPVLGVYGNHCDGRYLKDLRMTNLHLTRVEVGGVSFTGLEGCVRYKSDTPDVLYTQRQYRRMIRKLPTADVLVTHCPPRGINDHDDPAHVGIDALGNWLEHNRPQLMIHGHTYPSQPMTQYGDTRIEYVRGARIVLFE